MTFSQCNGTHAESMVCWLCSDKQPWWRAARIKAGLSADPPYTHPNVAVVCEQELPAPVQRPAYRTYVRFSPEERAAALERLTRAGALRSA